jgi:hypothetical protein
MPLLPDIEPVAVAWLKSLGLHVGTAVATTVPEASAWPTILGTSTRAFLQVVGTGGGVMHDTPMGQDVLSLDVHAVKPNSDRPPTHAARQVLYQVRDHLLTRGAFPTLVSLPDTPAVRIHSAWLLTPNPRRVPDQDTSRAHHSVDLEIMWGVS